MDAVIGCAFLTSASRAWESSSGAEPTAMTEHVVDSIALSAELQSLCVDTTFIRGEEGLESAAGGMGEGNSGDDDTSFAPQVFVVSPSVQGREPELTSPTPLEQGDHELQTDVIPKGGDLLGCTNTTRFLRMSREGEEVPRFDFSANNPLDW